MEAKRREANDKVGGVKQKMKRTNVLRRITYFWINPHYLLSSSNCYFILKVEAGN
jgi:hypothetical protein